jgi:hypothetical protein
VARLGGADDGAHPAQPAGTEQALGELVDECREPLVQRRVGSGQVLQVGGTRVAGADEDEDAGPGLGGRGKERLERIAPQQRVGGEGVGAESRDGAPWGRGLPDQRLRVGGGGDRDVAALAVGDDQQARLAGGRAGILEGSPPRRAQPLETGELGLDGDAGGARPFDQLAAVAGDRRGGQLGRRSPGAGTPLTGRRGERPGELGRVGIEAETDLTAALFDERRESIREIGQGASP